MSCPWHKHPIQNCLGALPSWDQVTWATCINWCHPMFLKQEVICDFEYYPPQESKRHTWNHNLHKANTRWYGLRQDEAMLFTQMNYPAMSMMQQKPGFVRPGGVRSLCNHPFLPITTNVSITFLIWADSDGALHGLGLLKLSFSKGSRSCKVSVLNVWWGIHNIW